MFINNSKKCICLFRIKSDGVRGVSGDITCNELYIQDDALDYAFSKWGKY